MDGNIFCICYLFLITFYTITCTPRAQVTAINKCFLHSDCLNA
ncbi:hypothetical protein CLOSYM_02444 [[Clostridium] symbiosum ATCC 14940]|uniref:Uncharacterized protein n=1 Tax=[Clostridium] symbiosum ATCC 14940 TaxID=411472 RepID=A0ABC9TXF4_CLOSY|nr:hypothetical protein CLOSYM_02444 [[Clostridium] symbiosum ATCC 14940]